MIILYECFFLNASSSISVLPESASALGLKKYYISDFLNVIFRALLTHYWFIGAVKKKKKQKLKRSSGCVCTCTLVDGQHCYIFLHHAYLAAGSTFFCEWKNVDNL